MPIAEVTVIPIGTKSTSLSKYVAECQKVLEKTNKVDYELAPMGTILEGELENLFEVIQDLHEVPFKNDIDRVTTNIKIDDRRDKEASTAQKLDSVESKLE